MTENYQENEKRHWVRLGWITYIFQDWKANPSNPRIQLILIMFRLAQQLSPFHGLGYIISIPYFAFYKFLVEWIFCMELHWKTRVGSSLTIFHGYSIVVHRNSIIGSNCILRQCTTIGVKTVNGKESGAPKIGSHVDIGANVVILGPITIGDNSVIGAGSVVIKDVPAGSIVAGNPAHFIKEDVV